MLVAVGATERSDTLRDSGEFGVLFSAVTLRTGAAVASAEGSLALGRLVAAFFLGAILGATPVAASFFAAAFFGADAIAVVFLAAAFFFVAAFLTADFLTAAFFFTAAFFGAAFFLDAAFFTGAFLAAAFFFAAAFLAGAFFFAAVFLAAAFFTRAVNGLALTRQRWHSLRERGSPMPVAKLGATSKRLVPPSCPTPRALLGERSYATSRSDDTSMDQVPSRSVEVEAAGIEPCPTEDRTYSECDASPKTPTSNFLLTAWSCSQGG